jgi:mitogen-activated protein kinase 1/3
VRLPGRAANDHPLQLGTRYVVQEKKGSGAYGSVFTAQDNESGDTVALKCVTDIFRTSEDAKRALREASILRQCDHPNIVKCRAVLAPPAVDFSHLWLVLDHADWDLRQVLRMSMKVWTESHVELLLHQILCGLAYMHEHGVVHRDLKPANILVTRNCHVYIADFGLARQIQEQVDHADTAQSGLPGGAPSPRGAQGGAAACGGLARTLTVKVVTRYYRAPELLLGTHEYNSAIDIWSVGCILAEMLSSLAPTEHRRGESVLFPGESGDDVTSSRLHSELRKPTSMLHLQFDALGFPTHEEIESLTSDSDMRRVLGQYCADHTACADRGLENRLQGLYPHAAISAVQLLAGMLEYTPERRLHARHCVCPDGTHTFADMLPAARMTFQSAGHQMTRMSFPFEDRRQDRDSIRGLILEETNHYSDQWAPVQFNDDGSLAY